MSFSFLGFEYRRVLSLQKKWRPYYAPKLKKRTTLFEKLREVFRQHVIWPVEIVLGKRCAFPTFPPLRLQLLFDFIYIKKVRLRTVMHT